MNRDEFLEAQEAVRKRIQEETMYNVFAVRNGKRSKWNKKPMGKADAEAMAADIKKSKIPSVDLKSIEIVAESLNEVSGVNVDRVFEEEYLSQLNNRLQKEFYNLQKKLAKDVLPWVDKHFDEYNVQRYFGGADESEREAAKKQLRTMSINLLKDALTI